MEIEILDYENHKKILYRNEMGVAQRILVLDLNNQIIQDTLSEYNENGKCIADIVFAPDHITIIGMRKYTENGSEDYRLINGELILVQKNITEKIDEYTAKSSIYNQNNELVFYDIYQYENDEIGMVFYKRFDKNNEEFNWNKPNLEYHSLQYYSDYS